jgi:methionyl-tRNA formyltransferase
MDKQLKISFAGTPKFAIPSLEALIADKNIQIEKVFTQPDKPVGRGGKLTAPPVKTFAEEHELKVLQPQRLEKSDLDGLDFLVVVAYGVILPTEVLAVPQFGCINLHASLLPKFRGASPIQSSILAGEKKTGVTFMQISEQLDSGSTFAQYEVEVGDKNSEELGIELAQLGNKFPDILRKIASGELRAISQNEAQATFCDKIKKEDGKVDWGKDLSEMLLRKLRAFTPWPGIWTQYERKILKLVDFRNSQKSDGESQRRTKKGGVFEENEKIFVKTIDGAIELQKVQLEGKKMMQIEEFVRGNAGFVGARLG